MQLFNFVEKNEISSRVVVTAHKKNLILCLSFQTPRIDEDWRSNPHGSSRGRHHLVTSMVQSGDARHLLHQYDTFFLLSYKFYLILKNLTSKFLA